MMDSTFVIGYLLTVRKLEFIMAKRLYNKSRHPILSNNIIHI